MKPSLNGSQIGNQKDNQKLGKSEDKHPRI